MMASTKFCSSKGHWAFSEVNGCLEIHPHNMSANIGCNGTIRERVLPLTSSGITTWAKPWASCLKEENQSVVACLAQSQRSPKDIWSSIKTPAHGAWHCHTSVLKNKQTCSMLNASLPPRSVLHFFAHDLKWFWQQKRIILMCFRIDRQTFRLASATFIWNGLFLQSFPVLHLKYPHLSFTLLFLALDGPRRGNSRSWLFFPMASSCHSTWPQKTLIQLCFWEKMVQTWFLAFTFPSANGYSCCSLLHACCSPNPMLQSIPDFLVSTCCLQTRLLPRKTLQKPCKERPKNQKTRNQTFGGSSPRETRLLPETPAKMGPRPVPKCGSEIRVETEPVVKQPLWNAEKGRERCPHQKQKQDFPNNANHHHHQHHHRHAKILDLSPVQLTVDKSVSTVCSSLRPFHSVASWANSQLAVTVRSVRSWSAQWVSVCILTLPLESVSISWTWFTVN